LGGEQQDGEEEDTQQDELPPVGGAATNPPLLLGGERDGEAEDQAAPPPVEDWSLKTVAELKEELRRRNLPVGGRKADLIERIRQDHPSEENDPESDGSIWTTKTVTELKEECRRRCLLLSGNRGALVARILNDEAAVQQRAQDAAKLRDLSTEELLALQNLEELSYEIQCRKADLIEYRSHLARHLSEDKHAKKELHDLADDEAIVTSDYKMKILACFFRENQKKWFGKRGTSMLGFMITTNSLDEDDKAKGIKQVSFVMMVTDDALQDEHEVACAKSIIYKQYLPPHVRKVRFTSDGAGCFKSQFHRSFQPFWKLWTGIDEISNRITPAGDGKSALDGMFGRLNTILSSAVDGGMSYWNSETIVDAVEASNGLAATEFARFAPDRTKKVEVDIQGINLEGVLLTTLDPDREATDQSILAYKHSGYGSGIRINMATRVAFSWWKPKGNTKKKRKEDLFPIEGMFNEAVSCLLFRLFLQERRGSYYYCDMLFLKGVYQ
jgi:hypothetical protein